MNKFLKTLIPFDISKGLTITGKHFSKVFFTANRRKVPLHVVSEYPEVPAKVQPRFRGRLTMLKDEAGEIKCVCCLACEKICPTQVITIESGKKEGRKTKLPTRYDFEMERCIFCEFCVESCGFDAIILNHQFELAVYDREDMSLAMDGKFQNMFGTSPVAKYSVADEKD